MLHHGGHRTESWRMNGKKIHPKIKFIDGIGNTFWHNKHVYYADVNYKQNNEGITGLPTDFIQLRNYFWFPWKLYKYEPTFIELIQISHQNCRKQLKNLNFKIQIHCSFLWHHNYEIKISLFSVKFYCGK